MKNWGPEGLSKFPRSNSWEEVEKEIQLQQGNLRACNFYHNAIPLNNKQENTK